MSVSIGQRATGTGRSPAKAALAIMVSLSMGACSSLGTDGPDLLASTPSPSPAAGAADTASAQNDLPKATEYWGKQYAQKPQDLDAALNFAKNLKAMGQKSQALAVLQQASIYHGANKKLASEYGRLALELDQVTVAQQMLAMADDPVSPDWRVISARGTVFAKQGKYQDAIPFYERALTLAPGNPSIMNNLALAQTMNGDAAKAEDMLRQAATANPNNAKVNQKLALVLGLQGKYDEATKVASVALPAEKAASNTALMRQMVKLEPKVLPQGVIAKPSVLMAASPAPAAVAGLKPAVTDQPSAAAWTPKVAAVTPAQAAPAPLAAAPAAQLSGTELRPTSR